MAESVRRAGRSVINEHWAEADLRGHTFLRSEKNSQLRSVMLGRPNHGRSRSRTRKGRQNLCCALRREISARCRYRNNNTCHHRVRDAPNPRSSSSSRAARPRRSPNSSSAIRGGISTSLTCPTLMRRRNRMIQGARRAGARDGCLKICAHGSRSVLPSEGFSGALVEIERAYPDAYNISPRCDLLRAVVVSGFGCS